MRGALDQRTYRHAGKNELTERQIQILMCVSEGLPDYKIGQRLFISEATAKRHVRDVLSKLRASNRANAVHIAHQKGIIS